MQPDRSHKSHRDPQKDAIKHEATQAHKHPHRMQHSRNTSGAAVPTDEMQHEQAPRGAGRLSLRAIALDIKTGLQTYGLGQINDPDALRSPAMEGGGGPGELLSYSADVDVYARGPEVVVQAALPVDASVELDGTQLWLRRAEEAVVLSLPAKPCAVRVEAAGMELAFPAPEPLSRG